MRTKLNIRNIALAVLCVFALTPAALFAGNASRTTEERGIIKSVDNNAHQLVVADQKTKAEGTFRWNDQTKITEHDKAVNASALKEGLAVHITYAPGPGTPMLHHVRLMAAKPQTHASASDSSHQKP